MLPQADSMAVHSWAGESRARDSCNCVFACYFCAMQVLANVHSKLDKVLSKNRALLDSLTTARDEVSRP